MDLQWFLLIEIRSDICYEVLPFKLMNCVEMKQEDLLDITTDNKLKFGTRLVNISTNTKSKNTRMFINMDVLHKTCYW